MKAYSNEVAHPILASCVKNIEERGLDVEQIYAKAGKPSQVENLKISLEVDHNSIDWNQFDPSTVAGVVKGFIRSLPEPLFNFPLRDRLEYSCNLLRM